MAKQVRGVEPPGFIHLPRIGLTPIENIDRFLSHGMRCWVYLKASKQPHMIGEPMAYFTKRLPTFQRVRYQEHPGTSYRLKLINPN